MHRSSVATHNAERETPLRHIGRVRLRDSQLCSTVKPGSRAYVDCLIARRCILADILRLAKKYRTCLPAKHLIADNETCCRMYRPRVALVSRSTRHLEPSCDRPK